MSHRDRDFSRLLIVIVYCDLPAFRLKHQFLFDDISGIFQILCKNTESVSTDCCLASVRIVNFHTHFSKHLYRSDQDSVCTCPEAPIAYISNILRFQLILIFHTVIYQIIISIAFIHSKCQFHFKSPFVKRTFAIRFATCS